MGIARRVGFIGVILALLGSAADARELWSTHLHGWKIGAYSNERTGHFNHCATGITYQSGIFLFFAIDRGFGWSMNLANNSWQLRVGDSHPIRYQVDRSPILHGKATVTGPQQVEIELLDSAALFRLFKSGRTLHIEAAGQVFGFDLTNSSKALDAALRCTSAIVAGESSNTNPFASSPTGATSNPFAAAPSQSNDPSKASVRAEAATLTANLLSAAKIDGFTVVDTIPADLDFYDAMWLSPGVIGGVMVRPNETSDEALASLAGRASANCKGRHASAKLPGKDGVVSLKLMCDETASTIVLIPRSRGGIYIVTVLPSSDGETSTLPGAEPTPPTTEAVSGRLVDASYNIIER
jgi:hypothetical protein